MGCGWSEAVDWERTDLLLLDQHLVGEVLRIGRVELRFVLGHLSVCSSDVINRRCTAQPVG
jgi:hypothetical protein